MKNRNQSIHLLKELLEEMRQELVEIDKILDTHNTLMQEDKEYLNSLMEKEPEEYRLFSPRSMADLHKEEIKEISFRRRQFSEENSILIDKRKILDKRIEKLEIILKNII